jgi:hypothetical protein
MAPVDESCKGFFLYLGFSRPDPDAEDLMQGEDSTPTGRGFNLNAFWQRRPTLGISIWRYWRSLIALNQTQLRLPFNESAEQVMAVR